MKNVFLFLNIIFATVIYSQNKMKLVKVNNLNSFFGALDDNTEIIVTADTLNFTTKNLEEKLNIKTNNDLNFICSKKSKKSYFIENDGIVLYGYNNLKIRGKEKLKIISYDETDDILTFRNSNNITLENIAIFHNGETCNGNVLALIFTNNTTIKNCDLNGSGAIGAHLIGAENITFKNTNIFNNAFHAISSINSKNIKFFNCTIYNNNSFFEEYGLIETYFSELHFYNTDFYNNSSERLYNNNSEIQDYFFYLEEEGYNDYYQFNNLDVNLDINSFIPVFNNCSFEENSFKKFIQPPKPPKNLIKTESIYLEFFIKTFVNELNDYHDDYFTPVYLTSFLLNNKLKINDARNRSSEDFLTFLYNIKYNLELTDFELFNIDKLKKKTFLVTIKAKQKHAIKSIKFKVDFNKKSKIASINQIG